MTAKQRIPYYIHAVNQLGVLVPMATEGQPDERTTMIRFVARMKRPIRGQKIHSLNTARITLQAFIKHLKKYGISAKDISADDSLNTHLTNFNVYYAPFSTPTQE